MGLDIARKIAWFCTKNKLQKKLCFFFFEEVYSLMLVDRAATQNTTPCNVLIYMRCFLFSPFLNIINFIGTQIFKNQTPLSLRSTCRERLFIQLNVFDSYTPTHIHTHTPPTHTHTYTSTHIHTHQDTHQHTHAHTHIHTHTNTHTHTHTHIHTHTHTHTHTPTHTYTHTHTHTYTHIHIHTHTHTHTHTYTHTHIYTHIQPS